LGAALSACQAIEACAAGVSEPIRQSTLFQRKNGECTFADPAQREMTPPLGRDGHSSGLPVMPLCYAAKHGHADLALWILERHRGQGRRVASFRAAAVAAVNGHMALAKEAWRRHETEREAMGAAAQEASGCGCPKLLDCPYCESALGLPGHMNQTAGPEACTSDFDTGGATIHGRPFASHLALCCANNVLGLGVGTVKQLPDPPLAWPALEWMLERPEVSCQELLSQIDWWSLGSCNRMLPNKDRKGGHVAPFAEAERAGASPVPLRLLKLLVEGGGARLDVLHAESHDEPPTLTLGQSILMGTGMWHESCWPWLVEEQGVDIQCEEFVQAARGMFFTDDRQDWLKAMR